MKPGHQAASEIDMDDRTDQRPLTPEEDVVGDPDDTDDDVDDSVPADLWF